MAEAHNDNPSQQQAGSGASLIQTGGLGRAVSRQPLDAEGREFKRTLGISGEVDVNELSTNANVYPTKPTFDSTAIAYGMDTPTRTIEEPADDAPATDLVPYKVYGASRDANAVTSFNEQTRGFANEQDGTGYTFDHPGKPVLDHIVDHRAVGGQGLIDGGRGGRAGLGHDVYTRDERRRYMNNDPQEP